MSQEITIRGFDKIHRGFDAILEGAEAKRREIHDKMSRELKSEVDRQIGARLHDSRGRVRSWQGRTVGSGGGYAAVRPIRGQNEHGYAYGLITNALENGHRVRVSRRPGYQSTSRRFKVAGRGFYLATRARAARISYEGADELRRWVKRALEGG